MGFEFGRLFKGSSGPAAPQQGDLWEDTTKNRLMAHDGVNFKFIAATSAPACRAFNSGNLSILSGTPTALTFDSERYDTDAIHDTGTNTSRLTCKTAGKYRITANLLWAVSSSGTYRQVYLQVTFAAGGTAIIANQYRAPSNSFSGDTVATTYDLAVNDYVEVYVGQDTGGSLNILNGANYSPEFMMERVA